MSRNVLRRAARCMVVSIGTTVLSTTILITLAVGLGVRAGVANAIAVTCGILPSYLANRWWVWGRRGKASVAREVAPFWALSIAGLLLSTFLVDWVGALTAHWSALERSVALPTANLAVFGALWVVQFFVLDRYIFHDRTRVGPHPRAPELASRAALATVPSLEQS